MPSEERIAHTRTANHRMGANHEISAVCAALERGITGNPAPPVREKEGRREGVSHNNCRFWTAFSSRIPYFIVSSLCYLSPHRSSHLTLRTSYDTRTIYSDSQTPTQFSWQLPHLGTNYPAISRYSAHSPCHTYAYNTKGITLNWVFARKKADVKLAPPP